MAKQSAGILLYRFCDGAVEVLLVHPGGPFHAKKDAGAWSIPKGEFTEGEAALAAALREFEEELGSAVAATRFVPLQPVRQKSGKLVHAWAAEGDMDVTTVHSNTVRIEYPYKSGKWLEVPEVDRAEWLDLVEARVKINAAQIAFLDELEGRLRIG